MRFLLVVLTVAEVMEAISEQSFRGALLHNFLKSNKASVKNLRNDKVISQAIAKTLNSTGSSEKSLKDDATASLVLMDISTAKCDNGWTKSSVTGMCYKVGAERSMSWYDSENWCYKQRTGSHLASVHSQDEAKWINVNFRFKNTNPPFMDNWLGLRRSCDNTTYIWTDGTPVDFLWWQPGEPSSGVAEKSCVTIWEQDSLHMNVGYVPGQWDDDLDCKEDWSTPTCKYDPDYSGPHIKYDTTVTCAGSTPGTTKSTTTVTTTTPTTTTVTTTTTIPTTETTTTPTTTTTVPTTTEPFLPSHCPEKCDSLWTPYNGGCYGIVKGTSDFETAELGCGAFGGEMAVITDGDMNEAIRKAFSSNNDSSIMNQAWIGASSYANWAPGKPNQAQGTGFQYCNVMALSVVNSGVDLGGFSRGVWMDYPCNKTQEYVICKQT